jgi:hypothetical protein
MKKLCMATIILLCLLLAAGCGRQAAPPDNEGPVITDPVVKERVPQILDADLPERDPFNAGGGSDWQKGESQVDRTGRDPFTLASNASDWEKESGEIDKKGRNPFAAVPNEIIVPEPVDPEPVDPTDPTIPLGDLVVELRTLTRCWLDVFVDDVRVLRTNVPSGETLRWEAKQVVLLEQVGREFGVQLLINGKDFGLLGNFAQQLGRDEYIDREAGVAITLQQKYPGGVLVGVKIRAIGSE